MKGILNEYHETKQDEELAENFGFQSEIKEIQQRVKYWQQQNDTSIVEYKIENIIKEYRKKIGIVDPYSEKIQMRQLIKEI